VNIGFDKIRIDGYTENGNFQDKLLIVSNQDEELLTVKGGVRASFTKNFRQLHITPYGRLDYVYRNYSGPEFLAITFVENPDDIQKLPKVRLDRHSGQAAVGLMFHLQNWWEPWVEYEWNFADRDIRRYTVRFGVRKQF
jgi:hypothetical protein